MTRSHSSAGDAIRRIEQLWDSGTCGALLVMLSGFAVTSVVLLGYPVLRSRAPLDRRSIFLTLSTVVGMLGTLLWLLVLARQDLHARRTSAAANFTDPLGLMQSALHHFAISTALIVVVLTAAAWRSRTSNTARAVALAGGLIIGATVWIAVKQCFTYDWSGCVDPELRHREVREAIATAQQLATTGKRALVLLSLACSAAGLAVGLREASQGRRLSDRAALGAAVLLATGFFAFAITRPAAADARLEIPQVPENSRCMGPPLMPSKPIVKCADLPDGNVVEWDATGPMSSLGWSASARGETVSPSELRDQLHARTRLWKQINPGKEFHGPIGLAAALNTPVSSLALSDIHSAGHEHAFLMLRPRQARLLTATLGPVSLWSRCCALELRLDPTGVPAAAFATYGDLLRAQQEATRRDTVLTVAP
jgi:hypothetical protein